MPERKGKLTALRSSSSSNLSDGEFDLDYHSGSFISSLDNQMPFLIHGRVYLGCQYTSLNEEGLQKTGITHIVSCISGGIRRDKIFKHKRIPMDDRGHSDLQSHIFKEAFPFMEQALNENKTNKILIHCKMGINRSPSLLMGFLMYYYKINFREAYETTMNEKGVCIHDEYANQLYDYDFKLYNKQSIELEEVDTTMKAMLDLRNNNNLFDFTPSVADFTPLVTDFTPTPANSEPSLACLTREQYSEHKELIKTNSGNVGYIQRVATAEDGIFYEIESVNTPGRLSIRNQKSIRQRKDSEPKGKNPAIAGISTPELTMTHSNLILQGFENNFSLDISDDDVNIDQQKKLKMEKIKKNEKNNTIVEPCSSKKKEKTKEVSFIKNPSKIVSSPQIYPEREFKNEERLKKTKSCLVM